MKTKLLGAVALLLALHAVQAQPPGNSAAPTLRVVSKVDEKKGNAYFTETVTRSVAVVKTIIVIENGQQVAKNVTETVAVMEHRTMVVEVAKSRVITSNGKQLPIDEVWKRLKANTVIAMSADGNTPAPVFLQALSEQTLIVIPPPAKN